MTAKVAELLFGVTTNLRAKKRNRPTDWVKPYFLGCNILARREQTLPLKINTSPQNSHFPGTWQPAYHTSASSLSENAPRSSAPPQWDSCSPGLG